MRHLSILLAVVLGCISCTKTVQTNETNKQTETVIKSDNSKEVIAKDSPIENKLSGIEYFFGSGSITKSQTVYYLYAKGGYKMRVKASVYHSVNVGDKYSGNWVKD